MPNQWTLKSAWGGRDGSALVGCHIIKTDDGKYQFVGQFPGDILSTTNGNRLPTPPFDFPAFNLTIPGDGDFRWRIHVTTLTGGASHTHAEGIWSNNDPLDAPSPATEEGGWTAQADANIADKHERDTAAASAGGASNV